MTFTRCYDRLISFAVSAMITASFLATAPGEVVTAAAGPQPAALIRALEGMRSSGWHGIQGAALPSPVTTPQSAVPPAPAPAEKLLSDVQIEKLTKLVAEHGIDSTPGTLVTTALGLTDPGKTIQLRQLNVPFDGHFAHAYHRTADGGWLIILASATSARTYRANAKQELVAAVDKKTGENPVVIPVADAQKELAAEFAYWAAIADKFGAQVAASH